MDLLTLREPEGLGISPDGKYVAFIVGQAVMKQTVIALLSNTVMKLKSGTT